MNRDNTDFGKDKEVTVTDSDDMDRDNTDIGKDKEVTVTDSDDMNREITDIGKDKEVTETDSDEMNRGDTDIGKDKEVTVTVFDDLDRNNTEFEKDKEVTETDSDDMERDNTEFEKDKEVVVTNSDDMDKDNTDMGKDKEVTGVTEDDVIPDAERKKHKSGFINSDSVEVEGEDAGGTNVDTSCELDIVTIVNYPNKDVENLVNKDGKSFERIKNEKEGVEILRVMREKCDTWNALFKAKCTELKSVQNANTLDIQTDFLAIFHNVVEELEILWKMFLKLKDIDDTFIFNWKTHASTMIKDVKKWLSSGRPTF